MTQSSRLPFALCFVVLIAAASSLRGQVSAPTPQLPQESQPPSTDIFLVEVVRRGGQLSFGRPANVTRREGYDNQPAFLPGGESFLYTSQRDGQTDIYRYDLKTGQSVRLTETAESEYSPTPAPGGQFFSVIRVEADKTQRLWKFPLRGGGGLPAASLVLEKIKPVGYHAWLGEQTLVLFVLGTPNTLQLVDAKTEQAAIVGENVGRSLNLVPKRKGELSFVHKISEKEWLIKTLDPQTRRVETLAPTLAGSEDFVWLPDGSAILSARGGKIYRLSPGRAEDWQEVADFSAAGVKEITRLALSPRGDRLALVATER
ncbi:MAG: TolB family protein [Pyrinomonadaceae bacterium]